MKPLFAIAFFSLWIVATSTYAQTISTQESPSSYYNNFQRFTNETLHADSALYYAQKLASNRLYALLLHELLDNQFAQAFIEYDFGADSSKAKMRNEMRRFHKEVALKMEADTSKYLREAIKPMSFWIKAQENKADVALLTTLTHDFMKHELTADKFYASKSGRYGLVLYNIIREHSELKPLALTLLNAVKVPISSGQIEATDSTSRSELDKRAWYRYLYAYISHAEASNEVDQDRKQALLKKAFDYSPDLIDKDHQSAYFYDMHFLNGKESYQDDYVQHLIGTSSDKKQALEALLKVALTDPRHKPKLKEYYQAIGLQEKPFDLFWTEAIEGMAKEAPVISLDLLDKKLFSSNALSGKWVLVDFWGTWCGPCRQEHPDLQQFYTSIILQNPEKISLLTVACNDTQEKVSAYMAEKNFSFPVAMSDNKVEKQYAVQGYPTKILITPNGKYLTVPSGVDLENFIKNYCNL